MRAQSPEPMGSGAASVGIVDSVPIFGRGLASLCEQAGLAAVELPGTGETVSEAELGALVIVLRSEGDWRLLARSCTEASARPIVAVVPTLEAALVEHAFSAGESVRQ